MMAERKASQTQIDSIRTVYLSTEDHEALHAIARMQDTSASALIRSFLEEYMDGKLAVTKPKPRKTSVWIDPQFWEEVRTRTDGDKLSVGQVIRAGIDRLRGAKR